jgi:hypothetical protein
MNKAKSKSKASGKEFLCDSFISEQQVLHTKLTFSSVSITHDGILGEVNEGHFVELLKRYLPGRYSVDSGIIVDSLGKTSDQIDVVIYDKQYSPVLLDQKKHRYIPSEAVYAIFEVKPTINSVYLRYSSKKASSVRKLKRTSIPICHAGGEFPAKPHFEIISGIISTKIAWKNGLDSTFKREIVKLKGIYSIDCGYAAVGECFDTFMGNKMLNIRKESGALGYFLFRLLQKLQTLGTVPAIDWNAYADILNNKCYPENG